MTPQTLVTVMEGIALDASKAFSISTALKNFWS